MRALRLVVLLLVIAVGLMAAAAAVSPGKSGVQRTFSFPTLLLCVILALPHMLYASVWRYPETWIRMLGPSKKATLERFSGFAKVLKPIQFICVICWWSAMLQPDWQPNPVFFVSAFAGMALMLFGQLLNLATYKALGSTGVYYGSKFGFDIPWVEGFPFNVVRHPQYVGCVLTIWGNFIVLWSVVTSPYLLAALTWFWTMLYAFSIVFEEYF